MTNAERYITAKLKELEETVLGAEEKLIELEYDIFIDIREKIEKKLRGFKKQQAYCNN